MIFEDEASFRQDSTLHRTWSRVGCQPIVPVTGKRESVKVFGCVDLHSAEFDFMIDDVFNHKTYTVFLETTVSKFFEKNRRIHYIQDGASYHRDGEVWYWFRENRKWIEVYNLPAYSPEFNAVETLWKFTRKEATHNASFRSKSEILDCVTDMFKRIQHDPSSITGYLRPFI